MAGNLGRFTPAARLVLQHANDVAERFGHSYIGQEHILIGIAREDREPGGRVLRKLGVRSDELIMLFAQRTGIGELKPSTKLDLAQDAKQAIENSIAEVKRLDQKNIGTEHLLLGLLLTPSSLIVDVLRAMNVTPESIREGIGC